MIDRHSPIAKDDNGCVGKKNLQNQKELICLGETGVRDRDCNAIASYHTTFHLLLPRLSVCLYCTDHETSIKTDVVEPHHVTITKDCNSVVPDCHGVTQNCRSFSVVSPTFVLVEMTNESMGGQLQDELFF